MKISNIWETVPTETLIFLSSLLKVCKETVWTEALCLFLLSGELTLIDLHWLDGKPNLAGGVSAALCQPGPAGAGAGLQTHSGLDQPDQHYYNWRQAHSCQGPCIFSCLGTPERFYHDWVSPCLISCCFVLLVESPQRAEWPLCSHCRPDGSDDLSLQGQAFVRCCLILMCVLSVRDLEYWHVHVSVLQRFYESGCSTKMTENERNHVCRFHSRAAAGKVRATLKSKKHVSASYDSNCK